MKGGQDSFGWIWYPKGRGLLKLAHPMRVYFRPTSDATTGPLWSPTLMLMNPELTSSKSTGVALAAATARSANWAMRNAWSGCHSGMLAAQM